MKKACYFPPVALAALIIFLSIISWTFVVLQFLFLTLPLFLSSFLLQKGKIWGIVPAILLGIYIIMDDLKPPQVGPSFPELGIIIIIYYLICAFCVC